MVSLYESSEGGDPKYPAIFQRAGDSIGEAVSRAESWRLRIISGVLPDDRHDID